jgi:hypothetical protein
MDPNKLGMMGFGLPQFMPMGPPGFPQGMMLGPGATPQGLIMNPMMPMPKSSDGKEGLKGQLYGSVPYMVQMPQVSPKMSSSDSTTNSNVQNLPMGMMAQYPQMIQIPQIASPQGATPMISR